MDEFTDDREDVFFPTLELLAKKFSLKLYSGPGALVVELPPACATSGRAPNDDDGPCQVCD